MDVPQLDLTRYTKTAVEEWLPVLREVALSGKILNGPQKKAFEEEYAKYLGVKYVLGVASGTDAIALSLKALGIGRGDEVITHANAFIADVEAILSCGALPVLVDMSAVDYGPDLDVVERAISPRTKAILAVHLLGMPVDVDPLLQISQKYNIPLVEDASQAQGAEYKGRKVGSFGKINAFSFGPVKNLAGLGDAGCIATDNDELFQKVKNMSVHGQVKKYEHAFYGWNSRLDEVQAAWLRIGLKTLESRNTKRQEIYNTYRTKFANLSLSSVMPDFSDRRCVFHQAIINTSQREALQAHLKNQGIDTGIYYPYALHEQEAWKKAGLPGGSFPRAEKYARENLALPMFAELTPEEINHVVSSVQSFFKTA